jgi:hypothetical protein
MMMDEEQSKLFFQFINLNYSSMENVQIQTNARNKLLENIIFYFSQHLSSFKDLKSLEVLSEIHAG